MSMARRWTKWWWQDWQRDPALRMCSPAARGIWMDLLAIMFEAEPCGHLLVNGRQPSERQLAIVCGASPDMLAACLVELDEAGVFSRTENGVIFNRRMVRDKAISDEAAIHGRRGGNPVLVREDRISSRAVEQRVNPGCEVGITAPLKHQEAEAETETDSSPCSESVWSDSVRGEVRSMAERRRRKCHRPKRESPEKDAGGGHVGPAHPVTDRVALEGAADRRLSGRAGVRGCRLPEHWWPSEALQDFARAAGCEPRPVAEAFCDYWRAVPGARGVKLDWDATFRNWCRRDARLGILGGITGRTGRSSTVSAARHAALHAQFEEIWRDVPELEAFGS